MDSVVQEMTLSKLLYIGLLNLCDLMNIKNLLFKVSTVEHFIQVLLMVRIQSFYECFYLDVGRLFLCGRGDQG